MAASFGSGSQLPESMGMISRALLFVLSKDGWTIPQGDSDFNMDAASRVNLFRYLYPLLQYPVVKDLRENQAGWLTIEVTDGIDNLDR